MNKKKVAIITGGTSGIGYHTAKKFLSEGYTAILLSMDDEKQVREAMESLSEIGDVTYYQCDVSNEGNCTDIVKRIYDEYQQIDVLANVAGIVGQLVSPIDSEPEDIKLPIEVNLMGTIYMSAYVAKYMQKRKSGVIINVSSICGFVASNVSLGYHASKGGINMVTKMLGMQLGKYGIRCVAVAPGTVRTRLMDPKIEKEAGTLHMKGRVIEPNEIANIIFLLTLDDASVVNGSVVMAEDGFLEYKLPALKIKK